MLVAPAPIGRAAGQQELVGVEGQARDGPRVLRVVVQHLARRQVPQLQALSPRTSMAPAHLDGAVLSAADKQAPVRAELDAVHRVRVALVRLDARLAPHVPHLRTSAACTAHT